MSTVIPSSSESAGRGKLLFPLLCTAALLCACGSSLALPPKTWYTGSPIMGGGIQTPSAGYVDAGAQVTCSSYTAYDYDQLFTPPSTTTYPPDTVTYTWTCSAGSFQGGNTGQSVTWVAPTSPPHYGTFSATLTCTVGDAASIPYGEYGNRNDTDLVCSVTVYIWGAPETEGALPTANLNSAAGANRCNFRLSDTDPTVAYGHTGSYDGQSEVDEVWVYAVPDIPVWPRYYIGDHFSSITLYGGPTGGTISVLATADFVAGSNTFTNRSPGTVTVSAIPVTYSNGDNYEAADGQPNQIWRISFSGLLYSIASGGNYTFAVHATPRVDRLWLLHAVTQTGATVSRLGSSGVATFDPAPWFGDKSSKLSMWVCAVAI